MAALRTSGRGGGAALSQKSLVKSAVSQLMLKSQEDEEEEEEDDSDQEDVSPEVKSADMVLPVLSAWYNNQYPPGASCKSPKKKAKLDGSAANPRPPLVVVLEDFEGFPAPVIQDFILNIA